MTADPNNIKSIFSAASEKPLAERAEFLEQATAGDAVLRARVEALLRAHDNPDSFLKEAAAEIGATIDLSPAERPVAERPARSSVRTNSWSRSAKEAWVSCTWRSSKRRSAVASRSRL